MNFGLYLFLCIALYCFLEFLSTFLSSMLTADARDLGDMTLFLSPTLRFSPSRYRQLQRPDLTNKRLSAAAAASCRTSNSEI